MKFFPAVVLAATLLAQDLPKPSDCPVTSTFTGTPAAPKFATPGQRRFRTVIRDAAKKGANFAGHYAIAQWGCGAGCVQIAVVDVQSGDVYDGPFGVLPAGIIVLSGNADPEKMGVFFQTGSSLLIARGCPNEKDCGTYYYQWSGTRFKLLRRTQD